MSHALEAARGLSTYSVNSVNKASSRGVDLSSMSTTTRHIRPERSIEYNCLFTLRSVRAAGHSTRKVTGRVTLQALQECLFCVGVSRKCTPKAIRKRNFREVSPRAHETSLLTRTGPGRVRSMPKARFRVRVATPSKKNEAFANRFGAHLYVTSPRNNNSENSKALQICIEKMQGLSSNNML